MLKASDSADEAPPKSAEAEGPSSVIVVPLLEAQGAASPLSCVTPPQCCRTIIDTPGSPMTVVRMVSASAPSPGSPMTLARTVAASAQVLPVGARPAQVQSPTQSAMSKRTTPCSGALLTSGEDGVATAPPRAGYKAIRWDDTV